jgi:hypothetical protein
MHVELTRSTDFFKSDQHYKYVGHIYLSTSMWIEPTCWIPAHSHFQYGHQGREPKQFSKLFY